MNHGPRSLTLIAAVLASIATCSRDEPSLHARIATEVIEAAPAGAGGDSASRDAAAERLGHARELLRAAGDRVLWGGFDEQKGYDPDSYQLTAFVPLVWAKVYLSTFAFTGERSIREEGRFTVVELAARFRDAMNAGEYPYPFWHSPKKWSAYVNAEAVLLVFDKEQLVAAFRKARGDAPAPGSVPVFDGHFAWKDESGNDQPRVALFSYLFSKDNPHVEALESTYRRLEEEFRSQSCVVCHAPDNSSGMDELVLLDLPNQALTSRHSLLATLRGNRMPPADRQHGTAEGIADERLRADLIALAETFESTADLAFAFEDARTAER